MTPAPLRIGVIGAGTISQSVHLPLLRRAGHKIAMICDLSPSRAAEVGRSFNAPATTAPEEVFASNGVDAVLIATPGSHAVLAEAALRAGKHVLAEKPVALTLAEIDKLETAVNETGRVLQVGYMKMYDPLADRARRELAQLSDVRLVRITVAHPADEPQIAHLRMAPPLPDADPAQIAAAMAYEQAQSIVALPVAPEQVRSYYLSPLSGSVIHELSVLRSLRLPLPQRWHAESFPEIGGDEPACLLATASVGATRYVLSWNWLPEYPEYEEEIAVFAANGRMQYDLAKPYLLEERSRLRVQRNDGLERHDTTYTETPESGFLRQIDAFAAAIREGAPVVADLAGARTDIECLQGIAQAVGASAGYRVEKENRDD